MSAREVGGSALNEAVRQGNRACIKAAGGHCAINPLSHSLNPSAHHPPLCSTHQCRRHLALGGAPQRRRPGLLDRPRLSGDGVHHHQPRRGVCADAEAVAGGGCGRGGVGLGRRRARRRREEQGRRVWRRRQRGKWEAARRGEEGRQGKGVRGGGVGGGVLWVRRWGCNAAAEKGCCDASPAAAAASQVESCAQRCGRPGRCEVPSAPALHAAVAWACSVVTLTPSSKYEESENRILSLTRSDQRMGENLLLTVRSSRATAQLNQFQGSPKA